MVPALDRRPHSGPMMLLRNCYHKGTCGSPQILWPWNCFTDAVFFRNFFHGAMSWKKLLSFQPNPVVFKKSFLKEISRPLQVHHSALNCETAPWTAEIKWLKQVPTGNRASWNRLISAQLVKCRKRYADNDDPGFRTTGPLPFVLTAVKKPRASRLLRFPAGDKITTPLEGLIFLTHPRLCKINKEKIW